MSEAINNRGYRQKVLKELIMELHNGKSIEGVKARFEKLIEGITAAEISEMEQGLIMDGMPVEEVQRLCDVHAAVFKGSIEEIHGEEKGSRPEDIPGHPVHTFKLENREIEKLVNESIKPQLEGFKHDDGTANIHKLLESFNLLWDIDKHYSRKENLLFPYMEKYGITAPPKVMWGVDDEIRAELKGIREQLRSYYGQKDELAEKINSVINRIIEMIFKEENILFPMVLETLTEDEWVGIAEESEEIGYCLTQPAGKWQPSGAVAKDAGMEPGTADKGIVRFETGLLSAEQISRMFNTLPVDITFIDKDDTVKYFSQGKERIFARTKAVIGRKVQNCHPPQSVHIVENLLEDFRSGKKDGEDFWIRMGSLFVYIRYFAIRNEKGEYLGTMEVSQNIKPIQELQGEKRLVSE